jgi:hypothetical protein
MNPRPVAVTTVKVTASSSHINIPRVVPASREGGQRPQSRSTPLTKSDIKKFHESQFPRPPTGQMGNDAMEKVPEVAPPSKQILASKGALKSYSSNGFKHVPTVKVPSTGKTGEFQEEIPVREVFQRIDAHIDDCQANEKYTRKRAAVTLVCICSCLVGVFFILMGLAEGEIFASLKPNLGLLVVGCLLLSPMLVWIYVFVFPSKIEVYKRKQIQVNRSLRAEAFKKNDARLIIDNNTSRRELAEARRRAEHQKHLDAIEFKKKNPLGYPTLGTTRHPKPW